LRKHSTNVVLSLCQHTLVDLSSISRRSQRPVLHLQFYPTIVGSSN
jgi:hypothetical protein